MSAKEDVLSTYVNLPDGVSYSGRMCPSCEGGRTKESSLSVSREGDTLKWLCHRASCGFAGCESLLFVPRDINISIPKKTRTFFSSGPLPTSHYDFLFQMYGIDASATDKAGLQITYNFCTETSTPGRIVIPVLTRDLMLRGSNLYAVSPNEIPKSKIVREREVVGMAWFTNPSSDKTIIVEDCYSAIRASKHVNAVALLGTTLSHEGVEELIATNIPKNYLALDNDAFSKTLSYVYEYRNKIKLTAVSLTKDIKNLSEQELIELIEGLDND